MAFPQKDETFFITGKAGLIETCVHVPLNIETEYVAVLCHPHPLFEGTMHNKVITTLAKAALAFNIPSIKFNFRGVGKSEGQYAETLGEYDDLISILNWLKKEKPQAKIILAGFSFGSFIALKGAAQIADCVMLITIAPAVQKYAYNDFAVPVPWCVIQGSDDEVVPSELVVQFVERRAEKISFTYMEGASHFFHGRLIELRSAIEKFIQHEAFSK